MIWRIYQTVKKVSLLGIAEASGAGAAFLATQPIDPAFKAVACGVLGFISVTLNGFWFKFVNTTKPQAAHPGLGLLARHGSLVGLCETPRQE